MKGRHIEEQLQAIYATDRVTPDYGMNEVANHKLYRGCSLVIAWYIRIST